MKNLNLILTLSLIGGTLLSPLAHAEKMNLQTQDMVIEKMERVLSTMDSKDSSWIPAQQRVADLLAERARVRFMAEVEANCDGCKGSKADRLKSIKIYESIQSEVARQDQGAVLFQLAHLYEMNNEPQKAVSLYERIIRESKSKKYSSHLVGRAHAGLADQYFQQGKFKQSLEESKLALKDSELENKGLVTYHMAWCEFNQEHLASAIQIMEGLLKNKNLLTKETEDGKVYDESFHSDLMRDLATFYAKRDVTQKDIAKFIELVPQDRRKELLLAFAGEVDRVGQKKAAHDIYNIYLQDPTLTKDERLEVFVKMAQVNYDRGQSTQSTKDFAIAAEAFQKSDCKDEKKCQELAATMKRYVTELHRSKKTNPDQDLLSAYMIYYKTFPQDTEMANRGASVAMQLNSYPTAITLYSSLGDNKKLTDKQRDEALLAEISAAEKSKDAKLQQQAYEHYLNVFPNGAKAYEVRYQMAYVTYQRQQLAQAAEMFKNIALDKKAPADLRKKSADLSLDCYAQLKQDQVLEQTAWVYAEAFPADKKEYENLARKALMNQVANVANGKAASNSDASNLLARLEKTPTATASNQEKILFYTNESALAAKAGDEDTQQKALTSLLAVPTLSEKSKEETLAQLVRMHERRLAFKSAYAVALKMKFPKLKSADKELRLGTLADLGGMPVAQKHYKNALSQGLKGSQSMSVRSRLVMLSSNPAGELKIQSKELRKNPNLLNETVLMVYAKTGDAHSLRPVLAMKEMSKMSSTSLLTRKGFFERYDSFQGKISKHALNTSKDSKLQASIKERVSLLKKADGYLAEAVQMKDITAQVVSLNTVYKENERMVKDLASLPLPAGLSKSEQAQYVQLLKQQSKPYLLKARFAQGQLNALWARSQALAGMVREFRVLRPELRPLMAGDIQRLAQAAPSDQARSDLQGLLSESQPTFNDLNSARKDVANNPDNVKDIEKLKILETKIGHPLMPAYLEARLNQIQKGTSL
jgi:hypothetical protein